MSRLRFAVAVAVVSAVTFLGSLLGATYLRTPTAVAASAKRAPSPTALAARIAVVNRRLDRLEQRLHRDGQKVENQLRNIEAAIDLLGGNACGLGSV